MRIIIKSVNLYFIRICFCACLSLPYYLSKKWIPFLLLPFRKYYFQTAHEIDCAICTMLLDRSFMARNSLLCFINFPGFRFLESKTAHAHSFYKIILFHSFLNKLASQLCSHSISRVKRSGDFQHSTEYYIKDVSFSFVVNLARNIIVYIYLYML